MREIITAQKASGNWVLQDLSKISKETIRLRIPSNIIGSTKNEEIEILWMTAIAIVYLMKVFKNQQVNWDLVVDKARKWIKKQEKKIGINVPFDWEGEASKFLSSQGIN